MGINAAQAVSVVELREVAREAGVGAVAAPLVFGALGLSLAQGTTFQPTPVEPVAIQALDCLHLIGRGT